MNHSPYILAVTILAACNQNGASTTQHPTTVIAAATSHAQDEAKRPSSPEEWKAALLSTYEEAQVKEAGDGITKFMANFKLPKEGANSLAFGERDAFRKLRFYSMGMPMQISTGVKVYISIKDNQKPVLFLQPYYWGHDWIFMNKVSILVDGELALEHECPNSERDLHGVGVQEQCDFIASDDEIAGLKRITNSSKVSVRLTGKKGYTNVGRDGYNPLKDFVRDVQSGIAIYDVMNQALEPHLPPI